jgi:hypothetical protein
MRVKLSKQNNKSKIYQKTNEKLDSKQMRQSNATFHVRNEHTWSNEILNSATIIYVHRNEFGWTIFVILLVQC